MVTRWTRELLNEARALTLASRYRSALRPLLVIFDVYPHQPEAQELASTVVRQGFRQTTDAEPDETLTRAHMFDSRLNPIFCECDAPGCEVSWVSAYHEVSGYAWVSIAGPLGARCESCAVTLCRRHLSSDQSCARCGGPMNAAPAPNGRRETNQTPRLNKRLVHAMVLVEGKRPPSAELMTSLCQNVMPDVFDDSPQISGFNERKFKGDGYDLGLMFGLTADDAYGTDAYDLRVYCGQQAERRGQRWVVVKVFENRPKHVDPDNPEAQR